MKFLSSAWDVTKHFLHENRTRILVGLGIGSMSGATLLAMKDAPKLKEALNERKKELKTEKLPIKEIAKISAPIMAPTAIAWGAGTACVIGGLAQSEKENAALAAAYGIAETARRELSDQVKRTFAPEQVRDIQAGIDKERVEKNPPAPNVVVEESVSGGKILCYDSLFGRYFYSDRNTLEKAMNKVNYRMNNLVEPYISLNEWYSEIGIPEVDAGGDLGWNSEKGGVDLNFSSQLVQGHMPCLVVSYANPPVYNYQF